MCFTYLSNIKISYRFQITYMAHVTSFHLRDGIDLGCVVTLVSIEVTQSPHLFLPLCLL